MNCRKTVLVIKLICIIVIVIIIALRDKRMNEDSTYTNTIKSKFTPLLKMGFGTGNSTQHLIEKCRPHNTSTVYNFDLPDAFDWRDKGVVGGVVNQLYCNACWAISIVGVIESMVAIEQLAKGTFHGFTRLSVQELIDCSYMNGCSRSDPRLVLEDIMQQNISIVTDKEYPLTLKVEECKVPKDRPRKGVMVKDFKVKCQVSAEEIMSIIYHHGPVVATVYSRQWINYINGIITRHCNGNDNINDHVIQIVGYNRSGEIPYYIVKNSWGTDFGDNGYVYVEMGKNLCGIEEYVSYIDIQS